MFKAISVTNNPDYSAALVDVDEKELPSGDVTVKIEYSTINYKDALAITGKMPVVKQFPMIPGIDFSGVVVESQSAAFKAGDRVLLNGWGVGEAHWGGLAEYAQVKSEWLQLIPDGLSSKDAMSLGTAGYTAMLCVQALEHHGITPESGEIVVSGAMGGVGGVALSLLSRRGYTVFALTGRPENEEYLKKLGAKGIISREKYQQLGRPLQKERWAGAVDVLGSHTLANICASTQYGGAVAACGLAQGMDFPSSVAPFILRGVSLLGIDSVYKPMPKRVEAWNALAKEANTQIISDITTEIELDQVIEQAASLIYGQVKGRLLVKC